MARARTRRRARVIYRRSRDALARDERGIASLLIGGIAGFVMNTEMVRQSEWLQKHWYALPIAMLLVGYMLARRGNPHGKTLMALGGYMFMNNFMNRPKDDNDTQGPATTSTGWQYLAQPPAGHWVVTPDGQWVLMPGQPTSDTAAPALPPARAGEGLSQMVDEIYGRM